MQTHITLVQPSNVGAEDVILDVRKRPGKKQIRGALRYDPAVLLNTRGPLPLPHDRRIVLDAERRADAEMIGDHLAALGFKNVGILLGGFNAWEIAALPTEGATQEQPVPDTEHSGLNRL